MLLPQYTTVGKYTDFINNSMKYGKLFACTAIFAVIFVVYHFFFSESEFERNARKLAERVVPAYAGKINFRQVDDTLDVFTLYSEGDKLVIEGNNSRRTYPLHLRIRARVYQQQAFLKDIEQAQRHTTAL